jgi:hypothetical protein
MMQGQSSHRIASSRESSNEVNKYLDELKRSKTSGAPTLSIGDSANQKDVSSSEDSESGEPASFLNELLHETESDDDGFDVSRLNWRRKRSGKKARQRPSMLGDGDDNEAIMAMLQRIEDALIDKGKSQGQRHPRGRQPRTNREVQKVKRMEDDDVRLKVLVRLLEPLLPM